MMTEAAFIAAVLAEPDSDTPRLIYADWLDEQGRCEQAEFIRVQCRIAAMHKRPCIRERQGSRSTSLHSCNTCRSKEARRLRCREQELLQLAHSWPMLTGVTFFNAEFQFRRGFIEGVGCTAEDWLTNADAILAAQPVQAVRLTDLPEAWTSLAPEQILENIQHRWPEMKFPIARPFPPRDYWPT